MTNQDRAFIRRALDAGLGCRLVGMILGYNKDYVRNVARELGVRMTRGPLFKGDLDTWIEQNPEHVWVRDYYRSNWVTRGVSEGGKK